ncbi:MAG: adenylosuccinate lyase [Saprospiraceae bacterium]|nr:adenylosuccinate lyase [Saprospiraceae bacterium]
MLTAISPVDGRYANKTKELSEFFSEYALIKYRIHVEIYYFIHLLSIKLPALTDFPKEKIDDLKKIAENFSLHEAEKVKEIESITNHDVKAVEYFLKEKFNELNIGKYAEFIHFGLTSQDINNTAIPLSLREAMHTVYIPVLHSLKDTLSSLAKMWQDVPMLSRTHGQPASPTLLGKEIYVFIDRIQMQMHQLYSKPVYGKFGGAVGNLNAHVVTYPDIDWISFSDQFIESLGLKRLKYTTQIDHYDQMAVIFDTLSRINTILIDLCRDIWMYISINYFSQKVNENEVGSSTMPHKVNPIDFENAEGNLGVANAIFRHLSEKLPISRWQRDLTDSTVLRNVGVPMAHSLISFKSIIKGLNKLNLNREMINQDLENNWAVVAEAYQTVLRREGVPQPYELLKKHTRGKGAMNKIQLLEFIDTLPVPETVKDELKKITPENYTGVVARW